MAIIIKAKQYQRKLHSDQMLTTPSVKIEVVKIEALRREELPNQYLNQSYNVFRDTYITTKGKVDALFTIDKKENDELFVLRVGEMYTLKTFQRRMRFIRKCGHKLRKINAAQKKKAEKNNIKQETFRI
ncbi:MAG: hypothetical protein PVG39_00475 [Desulfobacteraceae bacterium]|jgi:hypothetical protein